MGKAQSSFLRVEAFAVLFLHLGIAPPCYWQHDVLLWQCCGYCGGGLSHSQRSRTILCPSWHYLIFDNLHQKLWDYFLSFLYCFKEMWGRRQVRKPLCSTVMSDRVLLAMADTTSAHRHQWAHENHHQTKNRKKCAFIHAWIHPSIYCIHACVH